MSDDLIPPRKPTGRPPKRSPERAEVILNALRAGSTRTAAAGYADMDAATLLRWMKANAVFRGSVMRAEAEAEIRFTAVVTAHALGRPAQYDGTGRLVRAEVVSDPVHAEWWLTRRRREDYAQNVTVNIDDLVRRIAARDGLDEADVFAELADIMGTHRG